MNASPPKVASGRPALASRVTTTPSGAYGAVEARANNSALIYQTLRSEIVSLQRRPGEPIVEKDISAQFGVSRTPVREAVLRLASERLIEIVPQFGTFVARIPLDVLPEALVIRKALEEVMVRGAAERATRAHVAELRANLDLQREVVNAEDFDAFRKADDALHAMFAQIAGFPGIWTVVQAHKLQVDRYCNLILPKPGRMARLIREHTAICKAIRDGDADRAVAELHIHLDGILSGIDTPDNIAELVIAR